MLYETSLPQLRYCHFILYTVELLWLLFAGHIARSVKGFKMILVELAGQEGSTCDLAIAMLSD